VTCARTEEERIKGLQGVTELKDDSDEAAIEAGKLLVHEILENTVDNTGLLNTVE
jgi:chorismate mutase